MRAGARGLRSGPPSAVVTKVRRIVTFLQDMEREEELRTMPGWKAHLLSGDRRGTWSLSVARNGRLTFRIDQAEVEIIDLDDEDDHWETSMNGMTGVRMANPAHPGGLVKSEILEPLGLSVTDAAKALNGQDKPAGEVWRLEVADTPDNLTLAQLRKLGAADRVLIAGKISPALLAFARRDAPRETQASPEQLAQWVEAGEVVCVLVREG